jgi:hypothetical protein
MNLLRVCGRRAASCETNHNKVARGAAIAAPGAAADFKNPIAQA